MSTCIMDKGKPFIHKTWKDFYMPRNPFSNDNISKYNGQRDEELKKRHGPWRDVPTETPRSKQDKPPQRESSEERLKSYTRFLRAVGPTSTSWKDMSAGDMPKDTSPVHSESEHESVHSEDNNKYSNYHTLRDQNAIEDYIRHRVAFAITPLEQRGEQRKFPTQTYIRNLGVQKKSYIRIPERYRQSTLELLASLLENTNLRSEAKSGLTSSIRTSVIFDWGCVKGTLEHVRRSRSIYQASSRADRVALSTQPLSSTTIPNT